MVNKLFVRVSTGQVIGYELFQHSCTGTCSGSKNGQNRPFKGATKIINRIMKFCQGIENINLKLRECMFCKLNSMGSIKG